MPGSSQRRSMFRLGLAAIIAAVLVTGRLAVPGADVSALSRWTGGVDLYRSGVFTTQKSWLWCTAADIQIIRNIVDHRADHTKASQARYFDYMRTRNRYRIPVSDGVDPAGWTAGLRHYVDSRYRLVQSRSFDSALRSAVTNLRVTNLPVAITVSRGNHAWVLTGFTATADPARTRAFKVTSVRVIGPLWGLQSRTYGYDMRPDRKLTPSQLKGFFTPWHYAKVRMAWEGRWVSVQPVVVAAKAVVSTPKPTAKPTPTPTPTPTPIPTPSLEPPTPGPSNGPVAVAAPVASTPGLAAPGNEQSISATGTIDAIPIGAAGALLVLAVAIAVGVAYRLRSAGQPRTGLR